MDQIFIDFDIVGIFVELVEEVVKVNVSGIDGDSGEGFLTFIGSLEMVGKNLEELFSVVRS